MPLLLLLHPSRTHALALLLLLRLAGRLMHAWVHLEQHRLGLAIPHQLAES